MKKRFFPLLLSPLILLYGLEIEEPEMTLNSQKAGELYFLSLDLLVWDTKEEGLEYAYKNTTSQNNQTLTSYEPKSKFEPAFRTTLGTYFPYDRWKAAATYTYYSTDREKQTSIAIDQDGPVGKGLISVWTYPAAFENNNTSARFGSAYNHWKLTTSFLDLALSRDCQIGNFFSIRPEFGVRSAWIHQRYSVDYGLGNSIQEDSIPLEIVSSSIDMNCLSNNVGPLFGLGTTWLLGSGWNIFANFSTALMATHFHVGRGEEDLFILQEQTKTETIDLTDRFWTFRPQASLALGLSFEHFANPIHYAVRASYEAQNWWKQNALLRYIDELNTQSAGAYVSQTQGDLMFHGLTLEVFMSY